MLDVSNIVPSTWLYVPRLLGEVLHFYYQTKAKTHFLHIRKWQNESWSRFFRDVPTPWHWFEQLTRRFSRVSCSRVQMWVRLRLRYFHWNKSRDIPWLQERNVLRDINETWNWHGDYISVFSCLSMLVEYFFYHLFRCFKNTHLHMSDTNPTGLEAAVLWLKWVWLITTIYHLIKYEKFHLLCSGFLCLNYTVQQLLVQWL